MYPPLHANTFSWRIVVNEVSTELQPATFRPHSWAQNKSVISLGSKTDLNDFPVRRPRYNDEDVRATDFARKEPRHE
jgi:hypothetical protein